MKKIIPGDVFEIKTTKGFAYFQYTHKNEKYGYLIRVFSKIFPTQNQELEKLIKQKHDFQTFFPLGAAVNRKIVKFIHNDEIPKSAKEFPTFKCGGSTDNKSHDKWWLWDGKKEKRIGKLPKKYWALPTRGICNDTMLIERIEVGWKNENDV